VSASLDRLERLLTAATPGPWLVPEPTSPMTCVYTDATNVMLCLRDTDARLVAFAHEMLPSLIAVARAAHAYWSDDPSGTGGAVIDALDLLDAEAP
jgi:hypothetical protein